MASTFSKNLRLLRQENGLTQTTAAADLGISQALLSHYENDMREPGLAFIDRVCDYYHVTADFLLGRTGVRETAAEVEAAGEKEVAGETKQNSRCKSICDAATILFDLLDKLPNDKASAAAQRYLGTAIYRLYRALSNCSPDSSKVLMESENLDFLHSACNADLVLDEIEYNQALSELKEVVDAFPESSYSALKEEYPDQYRSLFQLVYSGNQRVNHLIASRSPKQGRGGDAPLDEENF